MIRLDSVSKRYSNGLLAVDDLSLEVEAGEIAILVGPSGCGKTTVLRMINRLIEPTSGRIFLDGDDVTTVDPVGLRRRIGYVIQQVGLFPHQTIARNVATVPRLLGWDKRRVDARVDELLATVGLEPDGFRNRYPAQLSGGQRQRVGVARALAADPPVLLMDEPFGAIDPVTRTRLQDEFLRLQAELKKTVVFVTHDIDEAVMVGDRICLMEMQARIAQYDTPEMILTRPASDYVAEFLGKERLVRRMSVATIDPAFLEHPAAGPVAGEPRVQVTSTLSEAFAAALLSPTEHVAVFEGERFVGTFTATSLLESLRHAGADGGEQVATGI